MANQWQTNSYHKGTSRNTPSCGFQTTRYDFQTHLCVYKPLRIGRSRKWLWASTDTNANTNTNASTSTASRIRISTGWGQGVERGREQAVERYGMSLTIHNEIYVAGLRHAAIYEIVLCWP